MSEEEAHAMRTGIKPMISIPPSKSDIILIEVWKLHLAATEEKKQKAAPDFLIKSIVADPRGVWFYQLITDFLKQE